MSWLSMRNMWRGMLVRGRYDDVVVWRGLNRAGVIGELRSSVVVTGQQLNCRT